MQKPKTNSPHFCCFWTAFTSCTTSFPTASSSPRRCSSSSSKMRISAISVITFTGHFGCGFKGGFTGTFIGNNEQERQEMRLAEATTSFWSYLNRPDVITNFLNPMYEPNKAAIWPSIAPVSLVLWRELYLRLEAWETAEQLWLLLSSRWVIDPKHRKTAAQRAADLIENDKHLRGKALRMRKQLMDLQKELQVLTADSECDTLEESWFRLPRSQLSTLIK